MEKKGPWQSESGSVRRCFQTQESSSRSFCVIPTLNLFSTRNGVPPQLSRYVFVHVSIGREMIVLFLPSATSKDSVSSSASSLLASWEEVSHCRRWLPPPVTHPSGAALRLGRLLVLNLHPFDN